MVKARVVTGLRPVPAEYSEAAFTFCPRRSNSVRKDR